MLSKKVIQLEKYPKNKQQFKNNRIKQFKRLERIKKNRINSKNSFNINYQFQK